MLDSFKPLIKKKAGERIDRNIGRQNPRVGSWKALDQNFLFTYSGVCRSVCVFKLLEALTFMSSFSIM